MTNNDNGQATTMVVEGQHGAATNSKQQSTNAQHAQRQTRDNDRMMWRMKADEVEDNGS
jgi:hypothetical protein